MISIDSDREFNLINESFSIVKKINLKEIGFTEISGSNLYIYQSGEYKILNYSIGTPLTTQYYLGSVAGESYGLLANKRRFLETELLNPKTHIENFYLTGQDICTLGVTGAMMGGILTANQILGYGSFTDIILGNNVVKDLIKKFRKRV